jgi:hypothetical protein
VDVDVSLPLPANTRAKMLDVAISRKHLRVAMKGAKDTLMEVRRTL